ncbi:hypothetical protein GIB67_024420 [Kingdonia uniflora]|uniref:Ubiquitin-like protease family profile domain-containing protein n=1 Tax=Kingdonia uniflora TaxID=39325 RepID=A0A7J7P5E6_9MAGN|nr:hypothetical protein GIB67_024420 [Kingdonia uniflora]
MGALTFNRKRKDDYFNLNPLSSPYNSPNFDTHLSKKPKFSSMLLNPDQKVTAVSRIQRYPKPTPLPRDVHAPKPKFRSCWASCVMGNLLTHRYEERKEAALDTFQHVRKGKEVVVEDSSSDEDLVILENVQEEEVRSEPSGVSDQRSLDTDGNAYIMGKYDMFVDYHQAIDTGEKLESPSVNRDVVVEICGPPPHITLYESAKKRDPILGSLAFQIGFYSKKLFSFGRPAKKPVEDVVPLELFNPLTDEDDDLVARALNSSNRRKVLVSHENSNIEITGEMFQCMRQGAWLNDEVINVYLELLKEREIREPKKFLKCHFFNTFFYKKLISGKAGYDFKAVRRWTTQRKIGYGLIECDKIFVPIHKEIHWCLAIINKKDRKLQYLDSLKGMDTKVMETLCDRALGNIKELLRNWKTRGLVARGNDLWRCLPFAVIWSNMARARNARKFEGKEKSRTSAKYFMDEVKDKGGKDIDAKSWTQEYVDDLPEQLNGWDCGMFMIKYADFYSRGLGLCFNQDHMPYFRMRTAKEILRLKAD